ncbi:MAG: cytochrome c family protein [Bacteroidota bacterium]
MNQTILLMVLAVIMLRPSALTAQHKYVGIKLCAPCHRTAKQGKQMDIWQKTKHAEAYAILDSAEAKEIAKKIGLTKPPVESAECLKCHAPQHDVDPKLFMKTFNLQDGVQCETCHGPGSEYKSLRVMKDRKKAIAAGMVLASSDSSLCQKCHNEESPTFKGFDYKEMWEKIKHPVPAAKRGK